METQYTHSCIKCKKSYKDNDVDAYYCSECNEVRKALAAEVDKRLAGSHRVQTKSDVQVYEEVRRQSGGRFPNIKSLGIKL